MENALAIVAGDFMPTGGMDRANLALAGYLAKSGRTVELVTHRVEPRLAASVGVRVHHVAKPLGSYFLGQGRLDHLGRRVARRVALAGGHCIVNGANCLWPDVNWVHYVHAAYQPQQASSSLRRLKGLIERPINLRRERLALQSARIVICNSFKTQRDVVQLLGVDSSRTCVIYYGIDAEEFRPIDKVERNRVRNQLGLSMARPTVCFVGALGDRRKGFDTLFAAWKSLCRESAWDAQLVVIGAGAELEAWRSRAAAAGLNDHCRFLGFRNDVPRLIPAFDLLVAPTRYEAYGLGVQEALACGIPAMVSADAGVAEQYPEDLRDLLLSDPEDDVDLAARLRTWRKSVPEHLQRIAPLTQRIRNRSWDDMSREILDQVDSPVASPLTT